MTSSPVADDSGFHTDLSPEDRGLFLAEVDELLERMGQCLSELEQMPGDRGLLNEIFRGAHTIKGSAAAIGHARMARFTHAVETLLDDVRQGATSFSPRLIDTLRSALAVLKQLRDEVESRPAGNLEVDAVAASSQPAALVFNRLSRLVHEVARSQGKQVELLVDGQQTELDRATLEELGEALVHLVRNAVDHGIEPPSERVANRKSAVGRLRLSAQRASGCIVVSLADDGRGIDLDGVRRSAVERGIATREHLARMSDRQLVDLIFAPGLSTVDTVTQLSGRGVGLDVVRSNLERMHGSVEIVTHKGSGTQFTLRVPEHAGSSRDTTIIPPAKAA